MKTGKTAPKVRMSKDQKHTFVKDVVDEAIRKAKKAGFPGAHVVFPAVKGEPGINQIIRSVGLDPRVEVAAMAQRERYTIRPVKGGAMIFSDDRIHGPSAEDRAREKALALIARIRANS